MPAAVGFADVVCREKAEVIWGLIRKASPMLVMGWGGTERQSWRRGSFAESRHPANTKDGHPTLCLGRGRVLAVLVLGGIRHQLP